VSGYLVPELACDGCGTRGQADCETTIAELRETLRRAGWSRPHSSTGDRQDLCPSCGARP
jgi:hypothetical protein